jgi:hypothetical protein
MAVEVENTDYVELPNGTVICGGCGKEMSRYLIQEQGGYWVFTCDTGRSCPNYGREFVNP